MEDKRTEDEKIKDYDDCVDAIEKLREFCVTKAAVDKMYELEEILLNHYEVK